MKAFRALAVAGAFVAASFQAQAATEDWGVHGPGRIEANFPGAGPLDDAFTDSFLFSLTEDTTLRAAAVSVNLPPAFELLGGVVQLFRAETGVDSLLGTFGFNGTTGNVNHTFASLMAGDYYYLVSGMASGSLGGGYLLTSTSIAAVPEPAQFSLFLAGLLAAGVVLRKRRQI